MRTPFPVSSPHPMRNVHIQRKNLTADQEQVDPSIIYVSAKVCTQAILASTINYS